MRTDRQGRAPGACPACAAPLMITRLQCAECGTEIAGRFAVDRLVNLPEPHASVLELFLRVRGNVKEMERELGLSYPTVRARLESALAAARAQSTPGGAGDPATPSEGPSERGAVLDALERGEISAVEAARRLRRLKAGAGEETRSAKQDAKHNEPSGGRRE